MKPLHYAGPMEGITTAAWRNAHRKIFGGADRYFAPFFTADQNHRLKPKDIRELSADEKDLVPQVLTDKADLFIWACGQLSDMGFDEVNLNTGCPAPTAVTRNRGSGLLTDLEYLDAMLNEIFTSVKDIKVSVKTRTGFENSENWPQILSVFNRYPLSCLIIHGRSRNQFYDGEADRELFRYALSETDIPLVYNGDIFSKEDEAFTEGWNIMAARGLASDPALFRDTSATSAELTAFHDNILESYLEYMSPADAVRHMKALLIYMTGEDLPKKIKKAKTPAEYAEHVHRLFADT